MAIKYVQSNTLYLAGAGTIVGATNVVLTSLTDIYGNVLTMSDFGAKGYVTLEPDTNNEEAATFTSVTSNANGTYTLGGVSTGLAKSPYTETSGLVRAHAGGTKVVITDNAEFWNTFANKSNDETIAGTWTFTNFPITGSNPPASPTVLGVSKLSATSATPLAPVVVSTEDIRVPVAYAVDSVGTDAYAITPSPVITAYVTGQSFTFKAGTANTGAATLNVNGLGAKTIKKDASVDLATGDIVLNQVVEVVYDGTNMQLTSRTPVIAMTYANGVATKDISDASTTQNIAHGLGRIPKKVNLNAMGPGASTQATLVMSMGAYNGTANSRISGYTTNSTGTVAVVFGSTTDSIALMNANQNPTTSGQLGTVTVDATNIIIAWTKNGTPSANTFQILWEAE